MCKKLEKNIEKKKLKIIHKKLKKNYSNKKKF